MKRAGPPGRRKGGPRRTRHPMPLPSEHEAPQDASYLGAPVAFGPQAELCRRTACCVCWARRQARLGPNGFGVPLSLDWTQLPPAEPANDYRRRVEAHHEPPRGRACASDDDDTIPLCHWHHQYGAASRHRLGARVFYEHFGIDWTAVRDEMRRRVRTT